MRPEPDVRRVVLVVLDGLRPDAIDRFDLVHLQTLMANGASSQHATTVAPSVTTAAMTSLLTGVSPSGTASTSDRLFIPTALDVAEADPGPARAAWLSVVGLHGRGADAAFAASPSASADDLDSARLRFAGKTAPEILLGGAIDAPHADVVV